MDVKTTFLNGDLEEEIYMVQPDGCVIPGQENKVCKRVKSLYGLKQAPKQWHEKLDQVLLSGGFSTIEVESCVYTKLVNNDCVIICLYVDDMLIATEDMFELNKLKSELSKEFDMKDLREDRKIIGIEIKRYKKNKKLWLSQGSYVEKVIDRFEMDKSKPISNPMSQRFRLSALLCPTID